MADLSYSRTNRKRSSFTKSIFRENRLKFSTFIRHWEG